MLTEFFAPFLEPLLLELQREMVNTAEYGQCAGPWGQSGTSLRLAIGNKDTRNDECETYEYIHDGRSRKGCPLQNAVEPF